MPETPEIVRTRRANIAKWVTCRTGLGLAGNSNISDNDTTGNRSSSNNNNHHLVSSRKCVLFPTGREKRGAKALFSGIGSKGSNYADGVSMPEGGWEKGEEKGRGKQGSKEEWAGMDDLTPLDLLLKRWPGRAEEIEGIMGLIGEVIIFSSPVREHL